MVRHVLAGHALEEVVLDHMLHDPAVQGLKKRVDFFARDVHLHGQPSGPRILIVSGCSKGSAEPLRLREQELTRRSILRCGGGLAPFARDKIREGHLGEVDLRELHRLFLLLAKDAFVR